MPELTPEEIEIQAAQEELKRSVLVEHTLDSDVIGQMQTNIDRMEREGSTEAPALDSKHPDNQGKTQYQIDQEILAEYTGKKEQLEGDHPEIIGVPSEPD